MTQEKTICPQCGLKNTFTYGSKWKDTYICLDCGCVFNKEGIKEKGTGPQYDITGV